MNSVFSFNVRTYECDSYGHVNNAVYLNYLEAARYQFLKDVGFDYNAALAAGFGVYIARVEIAYKQPAFCDDALVITTRPVKKGAVSGTVAQDITRGETTIASAKVTWAFVDAKGQPAKIPPPFDVAGLRPL
jgi:acyl-CoA thioester hydrolase